jgi:hypothetical protein
MDKDQSKGQKNIEKLFWSSVVIFAVLMWLATGDKQTTFAFTIFFMMVIIVVAGFLTENK